MPNEQPFDNSIIVEYSKEQIIDEQSKGLAEAEAKAKFDDFQRGVSYKKHFHRVVTAGIYVLGAIILCFIIIRAWHLVSPECSRWLTDSQLHTIDTVLFSSIIFSLASRYFSYYKLFKQ
jgi:hypothetical protein